ncbi:MAG: hydroxyacid dehydrogenase [Burkholderiales bacterium]|nr:hydroxyacid dehydrogenase [Phycisphaerae bacterium]
MNRKPTAIMILSQDNCDHVFGERALAELAEGLNLVTIVAPVTGARLTANTAALRHAEILICGWGSPCFDEHFLAAAPNLKAIFYAAGGMGGALTPAVWERNIVVTSANAINAIPVAEYTLSTILFSLKHGWRMVRETRRQKRFVDRDDVPGAFGSVVGLVSLGEIARRVISLLAPFELKLIAYDPFVSQAVAARLGITLVDSLDELFARADVVSVHTPCLPETRGMIHGRHLDFMKRGATFINTARATIVRQSELIEVAERRSDLQFVLDVADPEPPAADSPLYTLANVVLTPHIAGSVGPERRRLGRFIVEEIKRYLAGEPLQGLVTPETARHSAHRPMGVTVETFTHLHSKWLGRRNGSAVTQTQGS